MCPGDWTREAAHPRTLPLLSWALDGGSLRVSWVLPLQGHFPAGCWRAFRVLHISLPVPGLCPCPCCAWGPWEPVLSSKGMFLCRSQDQAWNQPRHHRYEWNGSQAHTYCMMSLWESRTRFPRSAAIFSSIHYQYNCSLSHQMLLSAIRWLFWHHFLP